MTNNQQADQISLIEAERAIKRVNAEYLAASDRFDVDGVLATMTDDIVWDGGEALGRHVGKAAMAELVKHVGGITQFTAHLALNERIDVHDDSATDRFWMIVPNTVEVDRHDTAQWLFAYSTTEFRCVDGEWLISAINLEVRAAGPHKEGWA
jgi:ketosteroid isomerase-like protein